MKPSVFIAVAVVFATPAFSQLNSLTGKKPDKDVVVEMVAERNMAEEKQTPRVIRIVDKATHVACYAVEGTSYTGFACAPADFK